MRLSSSYIIKGLKNIFKFETINNEPFSKKSYSQCGEDLIIDYVFNLRGIQKPTYIDEGANEPFSLNNTAIFYQRGCRGVNIDANPFLIQSFNLRRPGDININVGIHEIEGSLKFYIINDHTLSTFSKEEADIVTQNQKYSIKEIIDVQVVKLSSIFAKYFDDAAPDLLSIDVEGLDFEIIKSIDFAQYKPKVICIEAAEYSPIGAGKRKSDLINYVIDKGYYEYANTNLNAILVLKEFWFI